MASAKADADPPFVCWIGLGTVGDVIPLLALACQINGGVGTVSSVAGNSAAAVSVSPPHVPAVRVRSRVVTHMCWVDTLRQLCPAAALADVELVGVDVPVLWASPAATLSDRSAALSGAAATATPKRKAHSEPALAASKKPKPAAAGAAAPAAAATATAAATPSSASDANSASASIADELLLLASHCRGRCIGIVFNRYSVGALHIADAMRVPAVCASPSIVPPQHASPAACRSYFKELCVRHPSALGGLYKRLSAAAGADAAAAATMWDVEHWMSPLFSDSYSLARCKLKSYCAARGGTDSKSEAAAATAAASFLWCDRSSSDAAAPNAIPLLYGVSTALLPRANDWPSHVDVTGAWTLPTTPAESPQPPAVASLRAFLKSDQAETSAATNRSSGPVFIGFGSTQSAGIDVARQYNLLCALIAAVRSTKINRRVIVSPPRVAADSKATVAFDALAASDKCHIFVLRDSISHDTHVFPYCSLVIHHAGAGTTHSALRAGVPQLCVPFAYDQFWYADAVTERLGVGLCVQSDSTGDVVSDHAMALKAVTQVFEKYESYRSLAAQYAEILNDEERSAARGCMASDQPKWRVIAGTGTSGFLNGHALTRAQLEWPRCITFFRRPHNAVAPRDAKAAHGDTNADRSCYPDGSGAGDACLLVGDGPRIRCIDIANEVVTTFAGATSPEPVQKSIILSSHGVCVCPPPSPILPPKRSAASSFAPVAGGKSSGSRIAIATSADVLYELCPPLGSSKTKPESNAALAAATNEYSDAVLASKYAYGSLADDDFHCRARVAAAGYDAGFRSISAVVYSHRSTREQRRRLYVADTNSHVIRCVELDPLPGSITDFGVMSPSPISVAAGSGQAYHYSGSLPIAPLDGGLRMPLALAFDPNSFDTVLYVCSFGSIDRVQLPRTRDDVWYHWQMKRYDEWEWLLPELWSIVVDYYCDSDVTTGWITQIQTGIDLLQPVGVAVTPSGHLVVTDDTSASVYVVDPSIPGSYVVVAGPGEPQRNFTDSNGQTTRVTLPPYHKRSPFLYIRAITLSDTEPVAYCCDLGNYRVVAIDLNQQLWVRPGS